MKQINQLMMKIPIIVLVDKKEYLKLLNSLLITFASIINHKVALVISIDNEAHENANFPLL
jgi:hypothetical protein